MSAAPRRPPGPTSRLRLREMGEADLDAMAALLGDEAVMRYYPRVRTRAEALEWIRWNERNYAEHGYGLWVVETLEGAFVGDCGLTWQPVGGRQVLEVGYHVVPELQGRGYATEAARPLLRLAFEHYGLHRVFAQLDPRNTASSRLCARLGMTHEAHLRRDFQESDGRWTDNEIWGLLREEWTPEA